MEISETGWEQSAARLEPSRQPTKLTSSLDLRTITYPGTIRSFMCLSACVTYAYAACFHHIYTYIFFHVYVYQRISEIGETCRCAVALPLSSPTWMHWLNERMYWPKN